MIDVFLIHATEALFEVAEDDDKIDEYFKDAKCFDDIMNSEKEFSKFLSSPMIDYAVKIKAVDDVLDGYLSPAVLGFVKILIKKKKISHFSDVISEYQKLLDEKNGIVKGTIYSAFALSEDKVKRLEKLFSDKYKKEVVLDMVVDKSLIAGLRIIIDDTLYDYSLSEKIDKIKSGLLYQKSN